MVMSGDFVDRAQPSIEFEDPMYRLSNKRIWILRPFSPDELDVANLWASDRKALMNPGALGVRKSL